MRWAFVFLTVMTLPELFCESDGQVVVQLEPACHLIDAGGTIMGGRVSLNGRQIHYMTNAEYRIAERLPSGAWAVRGQGGIPPALPGLFEYGKHTFQEAEPHWVWMTPILTQKAHLPEGYDRARHLAAIYGDPMRRPIRFLEREPWQAGNEYRKPLIIPSQYGQTLAWFARVTSRHEGQATTEDRFELYDTASGRLLASGESRQKQPPFDGGCLSVGRNSRSATLVSADGAWPLPNRHEEWGALATVVGERRAVYTRQAEGALGLLHVQRADGSDMGKAQSGTAIITLADLGDEGPVLSARVHGMVLQVLGTARDDVVAVELQVGSTMRILAIIRFDADRMPRIAYVPTALTGQIYFQSDVMVSPSGLPGGQSEVVCWVVQSGEEQFAVWEFDLAK